MDLNPYRSILILIDLDGSSWMQISPLIFRWVLTDLEESVQTERGPLKSGQFFMDPENPYRSLHMQKGPYGSIGDLMDSDESL